VSKINILMVEDSVYVRGLLRSIVNSQPDMMISGSCSTIDDAIQNFQLVRPDVVLLSLNMTGTDELDLLEQLIQTQDAPVIIMSDTSFHAHQLVHQALALGVIGFVNKPKVSNDLAEYGNALCDIIRTASSSVFKSIPHKIITRDKGLVEVLPLLNCQLVSNGRLLVIGASTGGTEAIKDILMRLPTDCPGIVITQHMPEGFTQSFAKRLNNLCQIHVKEATHGERILPGNAYIAPGHSHLTVNRENGYFICEIAQSPPVNRHRPSVDVLFHSAARHAKNNAVGIILTGMGRDGADGMLAMHAAGAHNFAQDEASCVVFGMPKEAIARGGVDEILPLSGIADRLMEYLKNSAS
jgi:two-component system chemotaxis response regulator CheB